MNIESTRLFSQNSTVVFRDGFHTTYHKQGDNITYFYHYHDYYEITFYLGDRPVAYYHNGKQFELHKGDVIICDIFKSHLFDCSNDTGHDRFNFGISPNLISSLSLAGTDYRQLFRKSEQTSPVFSCDYFTLAKYMRLIEDFQTASGTDKDGAIRRALIHMLLADLHHDFADRLGESPQLIPHADMITGLVQYIDDHLAEKLTLEELAAASNYSVSYISRVFKQMTGQTLVQYILEKRILIAKQLIGQGVALGEAARRVGFPNYSYFYRCFTKSEGVTPKEYMKR